MKNLYNIALVATTSVFTASGAYTSPLPTNRERLSVSLEQTVNDYSLKWIQERHVRHIQARCISKEKTPLEMETSCAPIYIRMLENMDAQKIQILREGDSYPAVYGEWKSPLPGVRTVLIGGHGDVQPVQEGEWREDPFLGTIITTKSGERRLTGRGSSDDGQALTHLDAIAAYQQSGTQLPVNIKVLYEFGEERGSRDFDKILKKNRELLAADVVIVTDSGNIQPGVPVITYRTRGIVSVYVTAKTSSNDYHSGEGDGVICNANIALSWILSGLVDPQSQQPLISGLECIVPSDEEKKHLDGLSSDRAALLQDNEHIIPKTDEELKNVRWNCFSLDVHTYYRTKNSKGEITPNKDANKTTGLAEAYVTLRIPRGDPYIVFQKFQDAVRQRLKETCLQPDQLSLRAEGLQAPGVVDVNNPFITVRAQAFEEEFGIKPDIAPIGGTEPNIGMYYSILGIPIVYDSGDTMIDNAHGNNESVSIDKTIIPLIRANIRTYELFGKMK